VRVQGVQVAAVQGGCRVRVYRGVQGVRVRGMQGVRVYGGTGECVYRGVQELVYRGVQGVRCTGGYRVCVYRVVQGVRAPPRCNSTATECASCAMVYELLEGMRLVHRA